MKKFLFFLLLFAQPLFAQKLQKGFVFINNRQFDKANDFFKKAYDNKIEPFALYYGWAKVYSDSLSPFFSAETALKYAKYSLKYLSVEDKPESFFIKNYHFDFNDVEVLFNYSLVEVLNNVDKIDVISKLIKSGVSGTYEREILEEKAFSLAVNENSVSSYSDFIELYPRSKYLNSAIDYYLKKWFDTVFTMISTGEGFSMFRQRYRDSPIARYCADNEEFINLKNLAFASDNRFCPQLCYLIENSSSLNLDKDKILEKFIVENFKSSNIKLPSNDIISDNVKSDNSELYSDFIIFKPGSILKRSSIETQKAKSKSISSGKDFIFSVYGDNPYALKDFNRGRSAIADFYKNDSLCDVDWNYFADSLNKIDFNDYRFKNAIAFLQNSNPVSFYEDQSNTVGYNVFNRIAGAEIINNFGVYNPVFQHFENNPVPESALIFKSRDHISSYKNPETGYFSYFFVSTVGDSLVCGAYSLEPMIINSSFGGYKIVNIPLNQNNNYVVKRSNCFGLVFYKRKWSALYYLVHVDDNNYMVAKKYKKQSEIDDLMK